MQQTVHRAVVSDAMLNELLTKAVAASKAAYCPYSQFAVGAALVTNEGQIFSGCNVENASYGLTICAERNAVFQAVAGGARSIVALAIFTATPHPSAPCGACRQVMNEFGPSMDVYSFCSGPEVLRAKMSELLTYAFGPSSLA